MVNPRPKQWRRRLTITAVACAFLSPALVRADPVRISNGWLEAGGLDPSANAQLIGDNFLLAISMEAFNARIQECFPCPAGTTVDLSGFFDRTRSAGDAVVDGVTYPQIFTDNSVGTFSSGTMTLIALGEPGTFMVMLPFTFTAIVSGQLLDPFIYGITDPVFTKTLVGRGTAAAEFLYGGGSDSEPDLFFARRIRYDFSAAEPVPEPATLVLCGSVAIAALVSRRTRRFLLRGDRY
jgi:hypothetical protein